MKDIHAFEPIWENWVIEGEEIGHGSYGTVWKARREDQFSHVTQYAAVKHISIPKQDGSGDNDIPFPSEEAKSQYYRNMLNQLIVEIDAMISLRGKPNIVSYEEHKVVPKENNSGYDLFLRMELLKSVPKYIKDTIKRPLLRKEVIQLGIDIASALETLESRNLVHRDIKPDNIFIDDEGHFKLGDFGTARVLEVTGNASTLAGTPNYMAPEVYKGLGQYDQTVDIYSLGIMLYRYMNDGYIPFMSATALEADVAIRRRIILGEAIEPPCNADEELSRIILKACSYKAEDRYQNAQELKRDLLKCRERKTKEVEIPIVCLTDDGQEIFRGHRRSKSDSQIRITTEDIPYKKFVGEDKELISAREVVISIDENCKMNPSEAVFTFRDCKTLFAVTVQIICRDENNHEILVQKTECFYQNRNLVKAPAIAGYAPVGKTEVEVEVLKNRTSRPPQVVFQYKKETGTSQASASTEPIECDIPVLCMLESGEEILNSKRTCRENASNIVTAPEITGYVLIGVDSQKICVSHNGDAEPDKVIFTYKRMSSEKKETSIPIICRDDYGNELKRDSIVIKTGQTSSLTAPSIKGFKLISEDKNIVELNVDDKGIPSQSEVLFVYEKEKGKEQNKKRFVIIGAIATLLLISTGIAIWLLNQPIQKYIITWKHEDGSILELDKDVTADSMPEYNGTVPMKPEDDQYIYTFIGWIPSIKPVEANEVYVAVFEKAEKKENRQTEAEVTETVSPSITEPSTEVPESEKTPASEPDNSAETSETEKGKVIISDNPTETPVPEFTITWKIGSETKTTKVTFGEEPTQTNPVKDPDDQYTYEFTGWKPEVQNATADTTYEATFKKETRYYTITWQDDAGKTIDTTTVAYGKKPTHADPAKDADQQYTYSFSGWKPNIIDVVGDATYQATFKEATRSYTITWQDDAGQIIDKTTVKYGIKPLHTDPAKDSDQQYTYTFSEWQPTVEKVTGEATYEAVFKKEKRSYIITWLDYDGKLIDTTKVRYGSLPGHTNPENKADDNYEYRFKGWNPERMKVAENTTYTAVYEAIPWDSVFKYRITNKNAVITEYIGKGGKVTIPQSLGEAPVREIWTEAFIEKTAITTVVMPEGLEKIGEGAFSGNDLREIFFPSTLKYIGRNAFWNHDKLKVIHLDSDNPYFDLVDGVLYNKDKSALYLYPSNTPSQTTYDIPEGVKRIESSAFSDAYYLKNVSMPNSLENIGDYAFWGAHLMEIEIPEGVKRIGFCSFGYLPDNAKLYIPSSTVYIDDAAFWGCENHITIESVNGSYAEKYASRKGIKFIGTETSSDEVSDNIHTETRDTWICDNCKAKNSIDDTFCTNCAQTRLCLECGHCVPKDDNFCSNCATAVGKWKCTKCGGLSGANDNFCVNCGTQRHKPGAQ